MNNYIKLGRQIIFGYVFLVLTFIASPILIFILTHTLSVKEFGVYSLFAGLILVFGTFLELGLSQFVSTMLVRINLVERTKYFLKLLLFLLGFFLVLGLLLLFSDFSTFFLSYFNLANYSYLWFYVVILILAHSIIRFFSSFFVASKRLNISSFSSFMFSSSWVFILLAFFLTDKIFGLKHIFIFWLALSFVMIIILLTFYLRPFYKGLIKKFKISKYSIKKALYFSLPVIPALAGFWIIAIGDRYVLAFFHSNEIVGIYSLIYAVIGIAYSLAIVVPTILFPYLSEAFKKRKHAVFVNMSLKYSFILLFPALAGLYALKKEIILIFAGNNYLIGLSLFPYLIFYPFIAFLVFFFYQRLLIKNQTKKISLIYISGALINIIINIILIPYLGMLGAAIATLITYLIMLIWIAFVAGEIKVGFVFIKIFRIILATVIMVLFILYAPDIEFKGLWSVVIKICMAALLYFISLFLLKIMNEKEKRVIKSIFGLRNK